MSTHEYRRRLTRLEREIRREHSTSRAVDEPIGIAVDYVAEHGVDPGLFQRWLDGEFLEVDLATFTTLMDAQEHAWDQTGTTLPLSIFELRCSEAIELICNHYHSCRCDRPFGESCKHSGRWPGRPTELSDRFANDTWQRMDSDLDAGQCAARLANARRRRLRS